MTAYTKERKAPDALTTLDVLRANDDALADPPPPTKDAQLADLYRRAEVAYGLARCAEDAGDERRFARALERYWLRLEQAKYVFERPPGAWCPRCVFGEDGWLVKTILAAPELYACLDHWDGATAIVAARMSDVSGANDGAAVYAGEESA